MNCEIGVKVLKIDNDRDLVRPCFLSRRGVDPYDIGLDLNLVTEDGTIHICGQNDWGMLALEILEPIKNEAKGLVAKASEWKKNVPRGMKISGFELGLNEKRILDIYFGGKDKCDRLLGLSVYVNPTVEDKFEPLYKEIKFGGY